MGTGNGLLELRMGENKWRGEKRENIFEHIGERMGKRIHTRKGETLQGEEMYKGGKVQVGESASREFPISTFHFIMYFEQLITEHIDFMLCFECNRS